MAPRDEGAGGRRRIGAARGAVPGYALVLLALLVGAVLAQREGLRSLRLVALALAAVALWRLVWHERARLVVSGSALHVGRPLAEERAVPWHHIRLITVDAAGSEALLRDGERLRLPAPRGHLTHGPRAFEAAAAGLRAAIPESRSEQPAFSAPPAGGWTRRRFALRWTAVGLAVAMAAGWALRRDHPWEAPWWPGGEAKAGAPDPCAVAEESLADLGLARAPEEGQPSTTGAESFRVEECRLAHAEAEFTLAYRVFAWRGSAEATPVEAATDWFGWQPYHQGAQDVAGTDWRREDTPGSLELSHRAGNVVVTVVRRSWAPDGQPPEAIAESSRLAVDALAALDR
ncbi:hypothetical protein SAMN06297387_103337 [Streptomyces zhaozhouensis]|uniref:PH domain-containing protein n=1 Tax=Streptomyces zhaozhouensis TaxID=1300267 RepID=A0A286DSU5_9ACTN|nr:hypothetical protein [Streptomyces zhaozhouensis]SOD61729.1 hypothetical protein SAMN06297387_103337 [Streptomyces zhaozhouensis]